MSSDKQTMVMNSPVRAWVEMVVIPTCLPLAPDKNPMFFEKRVYQGSSGKIYPLPFTDRISEKRTDHRWQVVWLENEFLRVMILPEIGGRIHAITDKTNGYDVIYNQRVIKPALVGLAGPWISGGIELNWPQHHRPATFLPVDFQIEEAEDGSRIVWCSDHDPMARMKGMHGICLHPGRAYVELKVRAYNRTPFVQTFLWWANVAARAHEGYRSFFPPDVYYVADHARRSMSEYPLAQGCYYGVNYGERGRQGISHHEIPRQFTPPRCREQSPTGAAAACKDPSVIPDYAPNDFAFYANIPTPCSYMCMGSCGDFFGGYDYQAEAGIVHIASHHISPGKKQWTWGNHEFGYAWDRNLTDPDEQGVCWPYIELMAGVFTDNQPDFSFLQPGETKSWSQFWYPIEKIGPARHANLKAAVSLNAEDGKIRFGVCVTQNFSGAKNELTAKGKTIFSATRDLAPGAPFAEEIALPENVRETDLAIRVTDDSGAEIISCQIKPRVQGKAPPPAAEPPPPEQIPSADELFITGLHLEQCRHATRCPTTYWREALRRDPLDARCNNAMGRWHLRRGEFGAAEECFRKAIERLTGRNANPYDGEPYYHFGLCLGYQLDPLDQRQFDEAYAAFYKATWNQAWAAAGFHALAEMDCRRGDWQAALEHLDRSLRLDADNLRARNLKALALRKANRGEEAENILRETLALDPLDWWARHLNGDELRCDLQTRLDLAHDFARAGFYAEAIEPLETASVAAGDLPDQNWGASPMVFYTLGWLREKRGDHQSALEFYRRAAAEPPDYCFPARLEELLILESAMRANPRDARAPYYLGNLLYDRRRHAEAIRLWERSAKLNPVFSIVWRNLGIGYFNVSKEPAKAKAAYEKAFAANPNDARLLYERDQLWKRLGENPEIRLRELERFPQLTSQRDDLSVELCALYNQTGQHETALRILAGRKFQPWEGGEGAALGQHVRTRLALGRRALSAFRGSRGNGAPANKSEIRNPKSEMDRGLLALAAAHFRSALASPENLGEAKHLLANQSDIHYWLGVALDLLGDGESAREHWLAAANFKGDFQEMSVRAFSEMTYYSALALKCLGRKTAARRLLQDLLAHARKLRSAKARIDYFATSLPTLLVFDDDLQFRQETAALFLEAQAQLGLGRGQKAKALLATVLRRDPNHALAPELLEEPTKKGALEPPTPARPGAPARKETRPTTNSSARRLSIPTRERPANTFRS
jgi:tetratricopeptide (TPR) repeat protein